MSVITSLYWSDITMALLLGALINFPVMILEISINGGYYLLSLEIILVISMVFSEYMEER